MDAMDEQKDFVYLAKFSFGPSPSADDSGLAKLELHSLKNTQNLVRTSILLPLFPSSRVVLQLLYNSEPIWTQVYTTTDMACRAREQLATIIIPIAETDGSGGYVLKRDHTIVVTEERLDLFADCFWR